MMSIPGYTKQLRQRILVLCGQKRTSHIGGAFSVAEILAVLYAQILDISADEPKSPSRDRLYFSKGHACTALYAMLELRGFFKEQDLLAEFTKNGTFFTSHVNHNLPGVELSTGSLGHALGVSCGNALAGKRRKQPYSVFAILSDGELDEGSNWEAILFAAHHKLDNLIAVIDYNKIQSFGAVSDIMNLEPLANKFRAFNWEVEEIDGHSIPALLDVFTRFKEDRNGRPKCVIAHTVKGKGVSFMENDLAWHYRSPSKDDVLKALNELEAV